MAESLKMTTLFQETPGTSAPNSSSLELKCPGEKGVHAFRGG